MNSTSSQVNHIGSFTYAPSSAPAGRVLPPGQQDSLKGASAALASSGDRQTQHAVVPVSFEPTDVCSSEALLRSTQPEPPKHRGHALSPLAGSGLLIGFQLWLGLTHEIAQREGQVGQDTE